ncbi:hypothetical protein JH06_1113 [Blastocystis sp. subtype 4]|uniref:hypothetical protein n=1 Tax=Blastocystis sp. subtype 4 TaxID=944170 RepID=UPI0007120068|nr:hypothetical protein JH06_1113 [Blastocystis sp. subtype 4]KNB45808.1 hypothetical protein JH06_1113 [Blastocystis sp. subtype 4]|eukprot:XP_014529251.1 hypothetical protein JH06_1113 [Blastocystis sp. subtype 4]
MSGGTGFSPIKSTVHVTMLPYSYTNNDVAKLFEPCGRIARVTVLRDKETRESKGVAWIQFVEESAQKAIDDLNGTKVEKFTLKVEWAKDNGRGGEFIKKRKYSKAKYCFECGETGHTSYTCPKNVLGNRARPKKKKRTSGEDSEFLKAWLASDGDDI